MRALTIGSLLLAGLLLIAGVMPALAGPAHRAAPAVTRHERRGTSVDVELVGVTHSGRERSGHHFATDRLRSLLIQVHWKTLVGAHTQRLELITPDGSIYQTLTTSVESARGTAIVETVLPVSGTWITECSLHGRWHVNVYLDDAVTPVATARFTLAD